MAHSLLISCDFSFDVGVKFVKTDGLGVVATHLVNDVEQLLL